MAGPAPTFASTWVRIGRKTKILNELYKFGSENGTNFLDLYRVAKRGDATDQGLDGEFLNTEDLEALRTLIGAGLSPERMRSFLRPELRELGRVIGSTKTDDYGILRDLRDYMIAQGPDQTLNSRGMTLDTTQSGSVTGDGVIRRLTVDEDGYPLEATTAETKTFECIRDQVTNAQQHAEVFEFRGADREKDGLQHTGSGLRRQIASAHAQTARLLLNPSFETHNASSDNSAPTTLNNWSVTGSIANLRMRTGGGNTYRGYPGAQSTLWSVQFNASDTISQVLRTNNPSASFEPGGIKTPWFCRVAYMRKASATGTLTLHCGTQTAAATIGSATNDVWNHLFIAIGTGCYYKNFKEADLDVKLDVASLATGQVIVDDLILCPMIHLDGTWWVIDGGDTAWIKGDTLTFDDTDGGSRGINSYWFWRAFGDLFVDSLPLIGGWLPTNNAAGETIADPA